MVFELYSSTGVHLDSYILLGKLNYSMGNYTEALRFYERAQLDLLEEKQLPARSLKIMAEAFAIKALCFEKVSANKSKAKIAERESTVIKCYETAGDLTLLFLQVIARDNIWSFFNLPFGAFLKHHARVLRYEIEISLCISNLGVLHLGPSLFYMINRF